MKNIKFKIKILPVMLVLAVLSLAASAFYIYNMLEKSNNPLLTNKPDIALPNFVGMTEASAKADDKFDYEVEYVYSDEYEKDTVISQKPKAPRSVKEGSTVKLKVSKGVMTSEMPDVVMESRMLAQEKLNELGVHIYIQKEENKEIPAGLVIKTEPEAGAMVNSGEIVTVYIATAEKVKNGIVPNLIGKDVMDARKELVKSRLKVQIINVHHSDPVGTVVWQNHGAGAQLPIGTPVEIHVSNGEDDDD